VASAVFGTHVYTRFSPALIESVLKLVCACAAMVQTITPRMRSRMCTIASGLTLILCASIVSVVVDGFSCAYAGAAVR
jgi:phosphomevalonate kinase